MYVVFEIDKGMSLYVWMPLISCLMGDVVVRCGGRCSTLIIDTNNLKYVMAMTLSMNVVGLCAQFQHILHMQVRWRNGGMCCTQQ